MDANLIINDEYVSSVARMRNSEGLKLDMNHGNSKDCILYAYISILESIKNEAIISGEIANALEQYISCAKLLQGRLKEISEDLEDLCEYFIEEIDSADKYIF